MPNKSIVITSIINGVEAVPIAIECSIGEGLPDFQILGVRRRYGGQELTALFNFSENGRWIYNPARYGIELRTGAVWGDEWIELAGYGFVWLDMSGRRKDSEDTLYAE